MKKLFLASVSSLALAGAAFGADLTMPVLKAPPPPPQASWTGFYVGIDGGAVRHDAFFNDLDGIFRIGTLSTAKSGGVFGGYAGYNWQDRSFVYGLEADFNGVSAKASEAWAATIPFSNSAQQSQDVPWVATFRGRLGIDFESTLFYFTGGLAVGQVKNSFSVFCRSDFPCGIIPPGTLLSTMGENDTRLGWTVGAGFEHMFSSHWTLRGEFRYVDLGVKSGTCISNVVAACSTTGALTGPNYRGEFSNTLMNGLVGIGYKF